MKPIALKAKEGFGILTGRSKSTPPIPREQVGKQPFLHTGDSVALPTEVVDKRTNLPYLDLPIPHPVNPMLVPSPDPQPPASQPQTPMQDSSIPQALTFAPHLTAPVPPQNTPTSLEAYFLERKRRGVSGGGTSPRIITPTLGVKGKGFKSSPLTPTEREITDGLKRSKSVRSEARGGDGNSSEMVIEDSKLK